jgi:hypothetical protein
MQAPRFVRRQKLIEAELSLLEASKEQSSSEIDAVETHENPAASQVETVKVPDEPVDDTSETSENDAKQSEAS